jgi:hypothetical protein
MANVFRDGAEFGDLLAFDSVRVGGFIVVTTAQKRSGVYSYNLGQNDWMKVDLADPSEIYARFGLRAASFGNNAYFVWYKGATELGSIRINSSSQKIEAYTSTGTLVATGSISIQLNTWYLIEVHVKIADASGDIEVKVDGVTPLDIDFSGDTKPGADTTIDSVNFSCYFSNNSCYFDDLGINDTSGSVDNSWCGDGHIILLTPNANGDVTQLMGSDGNQTDNYLLVDDIPSDGDTTYVVGSGIGQYDLYNLLPSNLTDVIISRVWAEARARSIAATGDEVALLLKTGGNEYQGINNSLLTTYTRVVGSGYTENPSTSLPWTISDLDSLQSGVEVV